MAGVLYCAGHDCSDLHQEGAAKLPRLQLPFHFASLPPMPTALQVILFLDEIGSTPATRERTHDDVHRVNDERRWLVEEAIKLCGGEQQADTGDGFMLRFASCADAVRFGALVQRWVQWRNDGLPPGSPLRFDLHCGVDFGDMAVLGDQQHRGEAGNRAARVTGQGPAGAVWFTEKVAKELKHGEATVELVGNLPLKGLASEVPLHRLVQWKPALPVAPSPFTLGKPIHEARQFHGRENELRRIGTHLANGGSCQLVGPKRMGKSSLLLALQRAHTASPVAYVDLQEARTATQAGWLNVVGEGWGWSKGEVPTSEALDERVRALTTARSRPLLLLDECGEFLKRGVAFDDTFFLNLRTLGSHHISIVTAARVPFSDLAARLPGAGYFSNFFATQAISTFPEREAESFLTAFRPGVEPFSAVEREQMLKFAQGHPLALQVAAFEVDDGRRDARLLDESLRAAEEQLRHMVPEGWRRR